MAEILIKTMILRDDDLNFYRDWPETLFLKMVKRMSPIYFPVYT